MLALLKQHAASNPSVAAALAAYTGKAPEKSNKSKKKEDRAMRELQNRLPDGQWCKMKSCQFGHDVRHPGSPCYRSPSWPGPLPYKVDSNARAKARIVAARIEAGQRLGTKVVDLIPAKPPVPGNALTVMTKAN